MEAVQDEVKWSNKAKLIVIRLIYFIFLGKFPVFKDSENNKAHLFKRANLILTFK
jgi:hypothetical protein